MEHGLLYKDTVLMLNDKVMLEPLSLNDFSDFPKVDPTIVAKVRCLFPWARFCIDHLTGAIHAEQVSVAEGARTSELPPVCENIALSLLSLCYHQIHMHSYYLSIVVRRKERNKKESTERKTEAIEFAVACLMAEDACVDLDLSRAEASVGLHKEGLVHTRGGTEIPAFPVWVLLREGSCTQVVTAWLLRG